MTLEEYWDEQNAYIDSLPIQYSVYWKGYVYYGDSDDYNHMDTDSYDEAIRLFDSFIAMGYNDTDFWLQDNQYDYTMYYNSKTGECDIY